MEQERLAAVRFAVMAGARKAGSGRTEPAHRWSRWWRRALAAGVFALLAAVVLVALRRPTGGGNGALADVRLAPGAVGEPLRLGPDAVFILRRGRAEFAVPSLAAGQRYRVMVGGDVVEVRGTRFELAASASGLQQVRVREGRVLVRLAGKVVAELGSGEEWNRPGRAQAARSAAPTGAAEPVDGETKASGSLRGHGREAAGPAATMRAGSAAERAGRWPPVRRRTVAATARPSAAVAAFGASVPPLTGAQSQRDVAFRRAWQLLQAGRHAEAARAFDVLSQAPGLDPGRQADLLFWSAKAHQLAGEWGRAQARAQALLDQKPSAWHAPHAALLLGESRLLQGDTRGARNALTAALASDRASVRSRARELLRQLGSESQPDSARR